MKRALVLCAAMGVVGGCGGGGTGTGAGYPGLGVPGSPTGDLAATSGTLPAPWNRHFVTSFDPAVIAAVRAQPGYAGNILSYDLTVAGHPTLSGGGTLSGQPLLASRLDHAHSVGLSGAGQTLTMIDEAPRRTHQQFAGVPFLTSGLQLVGTHGTGVASVMVGNGIAVTTGYAPRARLHTAEMRYSGATDWAQLAFNMADARAFGSVAVNNSWTLISGSGTDDTITFAGAAPGAYFSAGQPGAGYLEALRSYAADGVVVFALQNDYDAPSASLMAALPAAYPDLEAGWIAAINAVPVMAGGVITGATRISAPCLEAARFCLAADGQIMAASAAGNGTYQLMSGASLSAPQVAGALALLAEAFPDLSPPQLRDRLLATADNRFFASGAVAGTHVFAPGVSHAYSAEFGHGFIDLRAALLPIGATVVPLASGAAVPLGVARIDGGSALGPGLESALAQTAAAARDGLGGTFRFDARHLVARPKGEGAAAEALRRLAAGGGGVLGRAPARDLAGVGTVPVGEMPVGVAFAILVPATAGRAVAGVSVGTTAPVGPGRIGATADLVAGRGAVLGLGTAAGERIEGVLAAARIGLEMPLGAWRLSLEGEGGVAAGGAAGLIASVPEVGFDGVRLGLETGSILPADARLGLFLRRPVAATAGHAEIALPVPGPEGRAVVHALIEAPLAAPARQVDLGLEFTRPLAGGRGALTGALIASENTGHRASPMRLGAMAGVRLSF